jgi:hypothetical protein
VVAGIQAAIVLHGNTLTAKFVIDAELRLLAHPLRNSGLEQVDEHLADISAVPVVPYFAKEVAPIVGIDGPVGDDGVGIPRMRGRRVEQGQRFGIPHLGAQREDWDLAMRAGCKSR